MQSVIGVFDTREDAESARESLIRAGFDDGDVRVQSHRRVQGREGSFEGRAQEEDEGFMAKVGHFFSDLFGSGDDAGHYAEHVRRGGSVVVVDVDDESRVDEARSALASAGAVDIDRRTKAWREERAGFQRRTVDRPATAADNGAIELEESTEHPVMDVEKTGDKERVRMRDASSLSGSSSEADMGVGMSGSSYSTTGSGSDTLSAARTFSGDETSQSAMSWQERNANSPAYSDRESTASATSGSLSPDDDMAYSYGSTLRSDQRYAGRSSWDEVEADARADWSERNPNSKWEHAKAAVRKGWESMTGQR